MPRIAGYPEDDLFTPTLTEEDDAIGFQHPWAPWSLVVLTFFFGIFSGGSLLALNFSRLGRKRKVVPAVLAVIAAGILLTGARWWSVDHLHGQFATRMMDLGLKVLETGGAGLLAWSQRRRYRVFRGSAGEPGKLLAPAILASVLSLAVQLALFVFIGYLFDR